MLDPKQIRECLGLSTQEMAAAMNTHEKTIYKWETGQRSPRGQARRLLELLIALHDKGLFAWYRSTYDF